jgi:type IV pilus assembly protein PilY1
VNEEDCHLNKTLLYVGSNDGMLHAFRDCDGSEAWAFIPPDLLKNLKYMTGVAHTSFADSTVSAYSYDHNRNGAIELPDRDKVYDKVILVFGQRRGGGVMSVAPATGSTYALDVSDPADPKYLWSVSNTATGFSELAESWSEPKIARVKIGAAEKIVAFIGGGYDNCNEDARFGATQGFPGACMSFTYANDSGVDGHNAGRTSSSASPGPNPFHPKGRGIYAVEIATLNSGVPDITGALTRVWGYTHDENNAGMDFSIVNEITALDVNNDGFIDRLYAADTGGNIWRFQVSANTPSSWSGTKIFSSNPAAGGDTDKGRKIFYKLSAAIEPDSVMLYFGTGDREHPRNRAVADRMYGITDRGQTTAKTESDLVDVTRDLLQASSDADVVNGVLADLSDPEKYGWFIKLDEHSGEKALAPAVVFNKAVYFTTYAPGTATVTDPCQVGNPGIGRMYAVDYKTGEAVMNYDSTNDRVVTNNKRATSSRGETLLRSDRVVVLGAGMPSGVSLLDTVALAGSGGGIMSIPSKKDGAILPVYWIRK